MWVIKAEDAKCSSGREIQTNKYGLKEPIMQNMHPERDLKDLWENLQNHQYRAQLH